MTYASQAFSDNNLIELSTTVDTYLAANPTFVPVTVGLSQNEESGFNALLVVQTS